MASIRDFTEFAGDWGGCARDSFNLDAVAELGLTRSHDGFQSQRILTKTIEKQIIPRLLRAHRRASALPQRIARTRQPSAEEIIEFANLLLECDIGVSAAFVEKMCHNGATLEVIFLELFSPAARYIGRLWEKDTINFADVTIALCRLQQLLRELSEAFEADGLASPVSQSALLVAAPGDQHTFGVFLVQEFFRRAGWHVQGGSVASSRELVGLVRDGAYDVIGLSVSNDVAVEGLASVIRAVREAALPRTPCVMVGGRFFLDRPDCVSEVGADATAQDGRRAVLRVSSLLGLNALG